MTKKNSNKMDKLLQSQQKNDDVIIKKLVAKLPFDIQASVSSLLMMAKLTTENAEKVSACQGIELISLRAEVRKKTSQIEQLHKGHEIYRERILVLEEKLKSLQDAINAQHAFTHQNKRAVAIMSSTNRMLIGSLEALRGESAPSTSQAERASTDMNETMSPPLSQNRRISFDTEQIVEHNKGSSRLDSKKEEQRPGAGDKLKESLLRVSREHYKYVKRSEALEKKVFELRSELETANQKIRDLKQELEEFRDGSGGALVSFQN